MNKVVVRTTQGEIIKGFTADFSRHKPEFTLTSTDGNLKINYSIRLKDLKAVFFVKTFEGNFLRKEKDYLHVGIPDKASYGKRILVTFKDGEEFFCRVETLHNDPEHAGFFIFPMDPDSNIIRAFFVNKSISGIQDLDT